MSDRLENKMDEVLGAIGGLTEHAKGTEKQLDKIEESLIKNGTERIRALEKDVSINTKFRQIGLALTTIVATVIGFFSKGDG